MQTRKSAVAAIGAELRAVAEQAPKAPLFELITRDQPLIVWNADGQWHANFGAVFGKTPSGRFVAMTPNLSAITETLEDFSAVPGLLDLVIYDTAESYALAVALAAAGRL